MLLGRSPRTRWITAAIAAGILFPVLASAEPRKQQTPPPRSTSVSLHDVDSWAYQLQDLKPSRIPKDSFDVLVVDYSRDGGDAGAFAPRDVEALRKRPNRKDRIVLAYLSIGEAEDYRFYWDARWLERPPGDPLSTARRTPPTGETPKPVTGAAIPRAPADPSNEVARSAGVPDPKAPIARLSSAAPAWLAEENPDWRGNFLVRYWEKGWKSIIFGHRNAYLDKIMAAGFDGIYMDKIDSNDDWQKRGRPQAEREMVEFVMEIAAYARSKRKDFLIVPQNGDELLVHPDYLRTIDAIAKEDLLFGGDTRKDGEPNPENEIASSSRRLRLARHAGKPVLAVEYIQDSKQIGIATRRYREWGFVPFFAERELKAAPEDILARVDALEVQSQARPPMARTERKRPR